MNRQALKISAVVKLVHATIPNVEILGVLEIKDLDIRADGSTHVGSLREIVQVRLLKAENQGKKDRRLYFTVA